MNRDGSVAAAHAPFALRALSDGSVLVSTYGCGLNLLTDVTSSAPRIRNVYTFDADEPKGAGDYPGACAVPLMLREWLWLLPVDGRSTLVTLECRASLHSTAGLGSIGRSGITGGQLLSFQDIEEADRSVEQSMDRDQGAFADAIAFIGVAEMFADGRFADAKQLRNFPVGLAAGRPPDHFALPIGEPHRRGRQLCPVHAPRGLEREGANQLQQWQMIFHEGFAGDASEGTRAVRLARNMRRDRKALANPFLASEIENPVVIGAERNHLGEA